METNVNYAIVGAFVIVLLAFIILGIIWLSSGFSTYQYKTYELCMDESVSGLTIDAPVEFNGVNVGSVKSIEINQKNPEIVKVLLNVRDDTPVTEGTTATLNSRSLAGIAYVALKDKGTNTTPLRAKPGEQYPVITTVPSFFMRLDTALKKLNDNIHQVAGSIQALLDEDNLRAIKRILINLNQVTGNLAANSQQLNTILHNTAKTSAQFTPLVQSSLYTMQMIQNQTLPAANDALLNLNNMTRNLSEVSTQIKQNPAILIRGKGQQPLGPGEK